MGKNKRKSPRRRGEGRKNYRRVIPTLRVFPGTGKLQFTRKVYAATFKTNLGRRRTFISQQKKNRGKRKRRKNGMQFSNRFKRGGGEGPEMNWGVNILLGTLNSEGT